MTLQKAIEILHQLYMTGWKLKTSDHYTALSLGIEALMRLDRTRAFALPGSHVLLPLETPETQSGES